MKNSLSLVVTFISLFFVYTSNSQILEPIKWDIKVDSSFFDTKKSLNLIFKPTTELGWYIYSSDNDPNSGPRTEFEFNSNKTYKLKGSLIPQNVKTKFDEVWDSDVRYLDNTGYFLQKVEPIESNVSISGFISYQVCSEIEKMCIPLEKDFVFFNDVQSVSQDFNDDLLVFEEEKSLLSFMLFSFFAGFLAILTPCVFPMIPLTVSYFANKKDNRKPFLDAFVFGLSIIIIFTFLGVFLSMLMGPQSANELATSWIPNIIFFLLFLAFGLSLIGFYELTVPSSFITSIDKKSQQGGFVGIFFMAFTLALVSFSCTGPIVGTLLVEAASGGSYMGPIIGMLGFSLAIALPFALFAAFPGWLNSLPQSGGWLNSVKVVLGFLELALAFKFLSNADLVMQAHLLERELFISIWIIIFALLTMYLLGFIKFSHDSDLEYVSVSRLFLAIITGMFTIYMIPGLWGAPLKIINAFPPPMHYSESPHGVGNTSATTIENSAHSDSQAGQHLGPQGIMVFHDYDEGLNYAKEVNKPLMLDFTGWACVNCRKMEEQVWSDPEVKKILSVDVVLVSLYVDERTKLDEKDQYETTIAGKKKKVKTIGDKWTVLQAERFKTNSQPYYVILDHQENQLGDAANYQDYGKVDLFKDWLIAGINEFNQ